MSYSQGRVPIRPASLKGIIFGNRTTKIQKQETLKHANKSHPGIEFTSISTNFERKMINCDKFQNKIITRNDVTMFNLYKKIKEFRKENQK